MNSVGSKQETKLVLKVHYFRNNIADRILWHGYIGVKFLIYLDKVEMPTNIRFYVFLIIIIEYIITIRSTLFECCLWCG